MDLAVIKRDILIAHANVYWQSFMGIVIRIITEVDIVHWGSSKGAIDFGANLLSKLIILLIYIESNILFFFFLFFFLFNFEHMEFILSCYIEYFLYKIY